MDGPAVICVPEDECAGAAWVIGVVLQNLAGAESLDELHVTDVALPGPNAGMVAHGPLLGACCRTEGLDIQRLGHYSFDSTKV